MTLDLLKYHSTMYYRNTLICMSSTKHTYDVLGHIFFNKRAEYFLWTNFITSSLCGAGMH